MVSGDTSEAFPVKNGVKQGCVLAPTLFSIVFAAMLTNAFQNWEDGTL